MKNQRETSLRIRLAGIAILGLFIALAAAAYLSGRQVQRNSELIATDAVPGMIFAHDMRMAMSRSVGYMMVAASAQTTPSRDASIKIADDADVVFTNAVNKYLATIRINPAEDREMLGRVTSTFAEFQRQRMAYEALILAGNREESAAFLETNLVPAYVAAIQPAEELLKYNNSNSTTYANYIRNSVHRLYWTVAVVMVLSLICAAVLVVNFAIRRREVMELRASEARFRMLIENAPTAISISREGKIIYVNQKWLTLFGCQKADDIAGRSITSDLAPEFREAILDRAHRRARGEPVPSEYEVVGLRKNGSRFPMQVAVAQVELPDGPASLAFLSDLTEQKRSQEELISKTAMLEAQVDSTIDGILVVDERGKRILQNRKFLELLKVPEAIARDDDDTEMLQHAVNQMKNPKQFKERVDYLYAHPEEIGHEEIELADGRIFDRYSSPVRDKVGKHYGRIWAFRDITKQRTLEDQFRQSQKMEAVGQLASGVAHDFNNILAIIQMQAELMRMKGDLSPEQSEFAVEIGAATQRAAALTRQLLLFSRKEKMLMRELDLNRSINDMTKMLRRTLGGNVELQFKFAMQPLFVQADAGMMDQVLMNLAVNARDAMPNGGQLIIETSAVELDEMSAVMFPQSRPGSYVCLGVNDTGAGIPPEILPKIFEPFFTTKDVGKGTGLGLATVFGIVQQHQGWINVYSEIGRGTTFRIYLPRLSKISGQKSISPAPQPLPGGNETILVVEDEPKLRAVVINLLSRLGYNVLEASDGVSAIEAWKKHRTQVLLAEKVWNQHRDEIHLLLTDMVMPGGMSGKDLGEQLLKENAGLKVIYVSGYSAEVAGKDFPLEEGVNFLTKPFQAQKLAQIIRKRLTT